MKGICACCFEPIEAEGFRYSDTGRIFHKGCVERNPNSYYVKLEELRARFAQAKETDLTDLMNEMERTYNIPAMNDESFNRENEEVMELYSEISGARRF